MRKTLLFIGVFVLLGIVLNVWEYKTRSPKSAEPEPQQTQEESASEETH